MGAAIETMSNRCSHFHSYNFSGILNLHSVHNLKIEAAWPHSQPPLLTGLALASLNISIPVAKDPL